jgi:hypothetical protein
LSQVGRISAGGIAAGLLLLAAAPAAEAASATFGANLASLPANNDTSSTCALPPRQDAPSNSPSCMWSYIDQYPNTLTAPATGTVTAIRVKVGSVTGPMRVNVIRFLYQQGQNSSTPMSSGPYLEAYGPEFTPAPNAVTTIRTNLPVQEDPTPPQGDTQTIQTIDNLALEVEAPNVPLPLFRDDSALSYPVYPGPTAQGQPAPSPNGLPSYTRTGIGVLMNADVQAGGGGGPGPGQPGAVPAVSLRNRVVPVRGGLARLPLTCRHADCAGVVTLLGPGPHAAGTRKHYGSAHFSARAGKKTVARVHLSRAGRALVRHKRRVKLTARVRFTAGGGKQQDLRVTLRR